MSHAPPRGCGPQSATISHSVYDVGVQATTDIEDTVVHQSRLRAIAATTTLFIAIVIAAFAASARHTGGHLIYALDDPYIHMAMARNVALLPALVFAGQEHILHALVNLTFVAFGASWLAQPHRPMPANATRTLCALATLLPLIRFESLFVIALVATLL